jgi:RNA polymerase sigma factor (sigma-70 family)
MSVVTTDADRTAAAEERFRAVYEENFAFLASIAANKFRVPDTEAETLAHEVFLTYLRKSDTISDLRSWLIGAICHASRHYWRANRRIVDADPEIDAEYPDPASRQILDVLTNQIAARRVLECLTPRYQEILRLRYFAGLTVPEIAAHLGVKPKYAQKLVSKCLKRAEKVFSEKGTVR